MSKMKTALYLLKNEPRRLVSALAFNNLLNWLPDKTYLELVYYSMMGRELNLKNPITLSEKIQWLKIYDRRPEYTIYADKYAVREFIKQTIGEEYLIPMIGVYDKADEIPWDELPSQFVLKCTHGSGANIICKDKSQLDIEESKRQLQQWMNRNWFWYGREWQYKNIKPRILCEQFMVDESGYELKDYKFHCFNGDPRMLVVILNRFTGLNANFYDMNWKLLPFHQYFLPTETEVPRPKCFDKMVDIAKQLSRGLPYIRVDYYEVYGHLYIGELTMYPASGWLKLTPESTDDLLGSWMELPIGEKES